ncbi:helix-turn-helix domain-containing protein [Bordetella genomosp. 11]|uniref:DNA-binding protein n=1 Tax=Bordetella genomosp. 11 TaxID=1416808 RepID=A0A261UYT8_9BORD|nr:XRE family transcriptional regulator [Bordetella genomosp. 11]OZI66771.1 DNA-binding protein [Bordetella genomosp. 11]
MDINQLIAARIRALRSERSWSLDVLADRSGVSRSAISLIERGESSPTALVLDKLAAALHVPLASLFERHAPEESPSPVSRAADQTVWTDPASGYVRRHLSAAIPSPTQLVEIHFPAGQRVSYETALQESDVMQQVWVIRGTMELRIGETTWLLEKGDCLTMKLDQPTTFHNPGPITARYLVALTTLSHKGI